MADKPELESQFSGGLAGPAGTELSTQAQVAHAQAQVQARYVMALKRPRDIMQVRNAILQDCKRPRFAETALYAKPVGQQKVTGFSIRFAESAARAMGNLDVNKVVIYDDDEKRIVRFVVADLESNLAYSEDRTILKTIERSQLRPNERALATRTGSRGQQVFIVRAQDDDLVNKEAAIASKAIRGPILRMIPGDILDEALEMIHATQRSDAAKDPAAEQKRISDAFFALGITPKLLADYLGHTLETLTPQEIVDLRALYAAIKDGETTWKDIVEQKAAVTGQPAGETGGGDAKQEGASAGNSKLAEKLAKKGAAKAEKPVETKPEPEAPKAAPLEPEVIPPPPPPAHAPEDGRGDSLFED